MAIAFDAYGGGTWVNPATSKTFSHTCTGSNLLLVLHINSTEAASFATDPTYAGVTMTYLTGYNANEKYHSLWYLINPATGANNVVISGITAGNSGCAITMSLSGVVQTSPIVASSVVFDTGSPYDISRTNSVEGNSIIGFTGNTNGINLTVNSGGQTIRHTVDDGNNRRANAWTKLGEAVGAHTYSFTGSADSVFLSVMEITPAASSGGSTPIPNLLFMGV